MGKDLKNLCDRCEKRPTCMYLCPEVTRCIYEKHHRAPRTSRAGGAISLLKDESRDKYGRYANDINELELLELFEIEERVLGVPPLSSYLQHYTGSGAQSEIDRMWDYITKSSLSDKEKETLILYFHDNKTQQEIANLYGEDQSAVAHRIRRAVEKLRKVRKKKH